MSSSCTAQHNTIQAFPRVQYGFSAHPCHLPLYPCPPWVRVGDSYPAQEKAQGLACKVGAVEAVDPLLTELLCLVDCVWGIKVGNKVCYLLSLQ